MSTNFLSVSHYTEVESEALNQLILDCDRFDFGEQEALVYIQLRFTKKVTRWTYYRRLKRLLADETVQQWFKEYATHGYAAKQKKITEALENTLATLERELYFNTATAKKKDPKIIAMLATEINATITNLRAVYVDQPYVAALKAELDSVRTLQKERKMIPINAHFDEDLPNEQTKQMKPSDIETARTIPMDSIAGKPQETTEEERRLDRPVFK